MLKCALAVAQQQQKASSNMPAMKMLDDAMVSQSVFSVIFVIFL